MYFFVKNALCAYITCVYVFLIFIFDYLQCLKTMLEAVGLDGKTFFSDLFLMCVTCVYFRFSFCAFSIGFHKYYCCFCQTVIKQIFLCVFFGAVSGCQWNCKRVFAGTCWHLRRLDWCEEVGEPLMDEVSV